MKDKQREKRERAAREGRLLARPQRSEQQARQASGDEAGRTRTLELGSGRGALIRVPAGYSAERPAPLALMLHGAGGDQHHGMSLLESFADEAGLILLAPASRGRTWDVILGSYGPDVAFIDEALAAVFARCAVDHGRLAVGGFSDGASYALSLGLTNGDLFTHVLAFSPGFAAPGREHGRPRLFISHGTRDQVLPINRCSRVIVPQAKEAGYEVRYREFEGPHTVPPEIAREAVEWLTGQRKK